MQEFKLLFENSNGGMYMPMDVDAWEIVEPTPGDLRVRITLANTEVIDIPINQTMANKLNELNP
jgi:hypothetical protein